MIDAHVHFWDPEGLTYPWHAEVPELQRAFLPTDLLEASAGCDLDGAVFVEADCAAGQGLEEARWVMQLAGEYDWIRGIVAFAPLERGEAVQADLEQLLAVPRVRGIRRLIQAEAPGFCRQAAFIEGVRCLAKFQLSCDLCLKHHQLGDVIALVDACPDTAFVLDHIAKPDIAAGLLHPWRKEIEELSRRPHVVCKLSGLVTEADHGRWTKEDLEPYIDHVVNAFGWKRLLYGSDWPVSTLAGGYRAWWEALEWALSGISPSERRNFFSDNAVVVYRLDAV